MALVRVPVPATWMTCAHSGAVTLTPAAAWRLLTKLEPLVRVPSMLVRTRSGLGYSFSPRPGLPGADPPVDMTTPAG